MGDYQPLTTDPEHEGMIIYQRANNHSSNKKNLYYKNKWTPLRKIAFISSLVLCISTISIFLLAIPCDWPSCPSISKQLRWDKTLYGLEMKGEISSVKTRFGMYLLVMARGAIWNSTSATLSQQFPPHSNGIICLNGVTGTVSWWLKLNSNPIEMDCSIIDIDNNGIKDCLVLGENGYLIAVDPESGIKRWKFGDNLTPSVIIERISFPIIIPDIDNDGISDLIAITRMFGTMLNVKFNNGSVLVLISGKTGHLLGNPVNQVCHELYDLILDGDSSNLSYTCKLNPYNNELKELSMKLEDFVYSATNKKISFNKNSKLKQHTSTLGMNTDYRVGKHRLTINEAGNCPGNCYVSSNLTTFNETLQKDVTQFSREANFTRIMNPVIINFSNHITGFILKIWEWKDNPVSPEKNNVVKMKMEKIHEQIVLFTYNETDGCNEKVKIDNASQSNVIRICDKENCQPSIKLQSNSMLLVDLDNDGLQEFVSYSVSYKKINENITSFSSVKHLTNNWELQSEIRVIHLEEDLSEFYKTKFQL